MADSEASPDAAAAAGSAEPVPAAAVDVPPPAEVDSDDEIESSDDEAPPATVAASSSTIMVDDDDDFELEVSEKYRKSGSAAKKPRAAPAAAPTAAEAAAFGGDELNPLAAAMQAAVDSTLSGGGEEAAPPAVDRGAEVRDDFFGISYKRKRMGAGPKLPQGPAFADEKEFERDLKSSAVGSMMTTGTIKPKEAGGAAGGGSGADEDEDEFDSIMDGATAAAAEPLPEADLALRAAEAARRRDEAEAERIREEMRATAAAEADAAAAAKAASSGAEKEAALVASATATAAAAASAASAAIGSGSGSSSSGRDSGSGSTGSSMALSDIADVVIDDVPSAAEHEVEAEKAVVEGPLGTVVEVIEEDEDDDDDADADADGDTAAASAAADDGEEKDEETAELAAAWDDVVALREAEKEEAKASGASVVGGAAAAAAAGDSGRPCLKFDGALAEVKALEFSADVRSSIQPLAFSPTLYQRLTCYTPRFTFAGADEERDMLFCLARTKFDMATPLHSRLLQGVYRTLTGSPRDVPAGGGHWVDIGFQGPNPTTDFRDSGLLGLLHMLYMTKTSNSLVRKMLQLSQDDRQRFPLMCVSLNFTMASLRSMRRGLLHDRSNKRRSAVTACCELHCALMLVFYRRWVGESLTIAMFGFLHDELVREALNSPKRLLQTWDSFLARPRSSASMDTDRLELSEV
eukprot:PLAT6906.1.p1 GENE.PLAT6906.1~~PLAT6906.1.p1  ORF type:complete len:720 (+),score=325.28 PLAT6906.1:86-2161(+)